MALNNVPRAKGDVLRATTHTVRADRRFTPRHPCPICGGHDRLPRGDGRRCHGFLSADGRYAHCSREEHANGLPYEPNSDTYAHRLVGDCRCGGRHDPRAMPSHHLPVESGRRRIVATYDYRDAAGELVYQAVRFVPKGFSQRRPDPSAADGWAWSLEGVQRVLYRLPALLAADPAQPVWYTEGEKDADALAALGLVATTNSEGAGKLRPQAAEALRGRDVIVLEDNDPAGHTGAVKVAALLHGRAARVRILALPDLPPGGDVSDWLAAGGTPETLARLTAATPPWSRPAAPPRARPAAVQGAEADDAPATVPPFPLEVFPDGVRRYVAGHAAALGVAPDLIAVPLLAIAAGAIGNTRAVEVKLGWREPAILWTGVVAPPGAGKSPALGAARHPVEVLQRAAHERYTRERAEWERQMAGKPEAGAAMTPRPVLEHFYTGNVTTEALAHMLAGSAGVTVIADELVGWVNTHDAYRKGGDRETYLSAWAGQPFKVDRRTAETLFVPRPVACVTGGIQPDRLPELRGTAERLDGFLDRFLLAWPDARPQRWTEAVADPADRAALERLFARLRLADAAGEAAALRLADGARRRFAAWYDANGACGAAARGLAAGFIAKYPGQLARLVLALHTLHRPDDRARPIPVETVEGGIALLEYFAGHLDRVLAAFGAAAPTREARLDARIMRLLARTGDAWVDRTTLHEGLGRRTAAEDLAAALVALAEAGAAESRVVATAGRPREEWRRRRYEESEESPPAPAAAPLSSYLHIFANGPRAAGNPEPDDEWGRV